MKLFKKLKNKAEAFFDLDDKGKAYGNGNGFFYTEDIKQLMKRCAVSGKINDDFKVENEQLFSNLQEAENFVFLHGGTIIKIKDETNKETLSDLARYSIEHIKRTGFMVVPEIKGYDNKPFVLNVGTPVYCSKRNFLSRTNYVGKIKEISLVFYTQSFSSRVTELYLEYTYIVNIVVSTPIGTTIKMNLEYIPKYYRTGERKEEK